ncbi:electron transfer flavoprotein subunit alpha/FixB family protein [Geomonas subterranea]|uniref:Electron transfer flavoprotein subunit alpha/FixB family protein n=1 Tax=Geomonas subterranea TaxID=2847989 RepID=A0ABX8LKD9_9BACT|nr:electron transfer flavoprotein subunit alpha/FixB family protein [Geomonas subterranea]QXE91165.1 electron transfer flavoprotein subunit alpha/FixB family protein [Geomonas subterranea]QXM10748.1 electron transfer flavoprotein subunit alpha/FixB family protein [Geomonas subterranea]
MKALLVGECRDGKLLEHSHELFGFASQLGAETAMVLIGSEGALPSYGGTVYLADASKYGEYNPDLHKRLVQAAVEREKPDYVVFMHTSYGWDLAPRVAALLQAPQVSEVVALAEGGFERPCCSQKMRQVVQAVGSPVVLTLQGGAFPAVVPGGTPQQQPLDVDGKGRGEFLGYEAAARKGVDLSRAEIIVSAGRGVGKKENLPVIAELAKVLGGEVGASRPVVDSGWMEAGAQVGVTGQTVSPKLYIACGISGAIQHLAGMKKSGFIVAINKDRDAPIGEVADVLVVADVMQFVPALTAKLAK